MVSRFFSALLLRTFPLLLAAACGSRTDVAEPAPDASSGADAGTPTAGPCGAACSAGNVCVHSYYTHDPPPPLPDGGTCHGGIERFDRCWSETDGCGQFPPPGCTSYPACACPQARPSTEAECCIGNEDGSFDCYDIGI